jgi:hypothetical protein
MRKLGYTAIAVVAACALTAAQDVERRSQTKVSVEDGKDIRVTGCVERGSDGFRLTHVANKNGALGTYILAPDDDHDMADHVGHRVEIKGKAADRGDGKIVVETKNERKVGDGDKTTTESKSELKGDLKGLPYLGVDSVRMIASVCP